MSFTSILLAPTKLKEILDRIELQPFDQIPDAEDGDSKEGRSLEFKEETLSLQAFTFSVEECKRQNGAGPVSSEAALVTSGYFLGAKQRFVLKGDKRALRDR